MSKQVTDLDRYRRDRERKKRATEKRRTRFRISYERARHAAAKRPDRRAASHSWAHGLRWWVAILAALLLLNMFRLFAPLTGN